MKRGTRVWCAVVVLMVGLILSTSLVQAVSQCGDQTDTCYCGKANPMPCCDNNCNGNKIDVCDGNCIWWAWQQACCEWGVGLPDSVSKWDDGRTYSRTVPVIGAIAIRCGAVQESGGDIRCAPHKLKHTAYVVWVSGDKNYVKVSEMNCWRPKGTEPCPGDPGYKGCSGKPCSTCETTGHSYRYHTYPSSWFSYYIYPPSISLLPAPSLYSPSNNQKDVSTTPYFDWSDVSGANRYWLMVAKSKSDLPTNPNAESCPKCVISEMWLTSSKYQTPSSKKLEKGKTYYWQVQAFYWDGSKVTKQGEYSEQWSFTTKPTSCQYSCWDRSALSGNELATLVRNHFPLGGVPQTGESIRVTAYAVAKAESGGNPSACGDNDKSIGLWQINIDYHPEYDKCCLFEEDYNANAAKEISNNGKDWNPWCTWEKTACGGNGNEAYKQYLTEARKHFYPKVTSLSVSSTSISLGESVKIYYSVSDDVGLDRVELWRTVDKNGVPDDSNWNKVKQVSISGTTYSAYFTDTPTSPGIYWYGIHVVDNSGAPEAWNDEGNSRTGNWPGVYGPDKVVVTLAHRTITFYTDPSTGGTITFAGSTYTNGQSTTKTDGTYPVSANPASNYMFDHWSTTGGVSVANPNAQLTTATVTGDGSIKAWFNEDTTPPSASISINSGATYTTTTSVTLSLTYSDSGSGVDKCRYKNSGGSWTSWQSCTSTKPWTLSSGDGTKTVYYQVRDKAGNIREVSDTIILDTTPPPAPVISSSTHPDENKWYCNRNPTFTWTTPSDSSGIACYSYTLDLSSSTTPDTTCDTTGNSKSYTNLAYGTWYFHVRAKDNAGNWGPADHYRVQLEDCDLKDGCYAYGTGCEDRDYYCDGSVCKYTVSNRHTDYYDDWVNYCKGDEVWKHRLFHDFYCEGGSCKDHTRWKDDQLVKNCNVHDNWYDTEKTKWITVKEYACKIEQKEQKEQKYRDYYCSGGSCTHKVTSTKWVDTGKTRTVNKPDGTDCCSGGNCDGWYDTGKTKWVTTKEYECKYDQKEQKEQEYRDYYCSGGSCTHKVTKTQWIDTGNTRTINKEDGTDCGFDGWFDTGETKWVENANPCYEKEQKEQEYRDYYCSSGSCTYEVKNTRWIDTGNTRERIKAIDVRPESCSMNISKEKQFSAIATLTSGGTEDVTSNASWSSNNTSVLEYLGRGKFKAKNEVVSL